MVCIQDAELRNAVGRVKRYLPNVEHIKYEVVLLLDELAKHCGTRFPPSRARHAKPMASCSLSFIVLVPFTRYGNATDSTPYSTQAIASWGHSRTAGVLLGSGECAEGY
eukprot:scaffold85538_cov54-Attheya_sp.AAC.1